MGDKGKILVQEGRGEEGWEMKISSQYRKGEEGKDGSDSKILMKGSRGKETIVRGELKQVSKQEVRWAMERTVYKIFVYGVR